MQPAALPLGVTDHPPAQRCLTHDLLKGFAVLLMMQVHVMQLLATPAWLDSTVGQVSLLLGGAPVAPVFLLLFGFYALKMPVWPGQLLWRAGKLLLLGLALNVGMNLHLFWRIWQGQLALHPLNYLLGVDILLLAGLSLIAMTFLRPWLKANPWAWLLASLGVAAASPWVTRLTSQFWTSANGTPSGGQWLGAFVALPTPWSYFALFPWLAYPLLGVAVFYGHKQHKLTGVWHQITLSLVALALWLTLPFAVSTSHQLGQYYHHGLAFYCWTAGLMVCWAGALNRVRLPASVANWVAWFGRHVTACYVVQWLLVGNLATALYKTQSLVACVLWVLALVLLTRGLVGWGLRLLQLQPQQSMRA